jgi:hypothetical protein
MSRLLSTFNSFDDLLENIPDTRNRLEALFAYLQASERQLIDLINAANSGAQHVAPPVDAEGDLEFGLMLYWLQHPVEDHINVLLASPAHSIATQALVRLAPPTAITEEMFSMFSGNAYKTGFVAADGSLYTLDQYAQIDPLWLVTVVHYAINLLDPDSIYHPFPADPYQATIDAETEKITIAVIGDWGTGVYDAAYDGQGPAVAVMNAVRSLKPDYVVHLWATFTIAARTSASRCMRNTTTSSTNGIPAPARRPASPSTPTTRCTAEPKA